MQYSGEKTADRGYFLWAGFLSAELDIRSGILSHADRIFSGMVENGFLYCESGIAAGEFRGGNIFRLSFSVAGGETGYAVQTVYPLSHSEPNTFYYIGLEIFQHIENADEICAGFDPITD